MVKTRLLDYTAVAGLLLVVGCSPFAFGAVHPISYTAFQVATFCLVAVAATSAAFNSNRSGRRELRRLCWLAACFGILAALQLLRLPEPFLRIVSPDTLSAVRSAMPWKSNIHTTSISLYPLGTQLSASQYLACFGVFILTIGLFYSRNRRLLLAWFMTSIGVALALVGLYQHWRSTEGIYGFWQSMHGGANFGPFVNRNHFAGYLEMILPISAVLVFIRPHNNNEVGKNSCRLEGRHDIHWWQIAALCCFFVMFVALVASLSRGGMISAGVAGCIMSAIAWRKARTRRASLGFAAVFITGFLLGAYYAGPELSDRLTDLYEDVTRPLETTRAIATIRTLKLFALYPVFGTGLGSFGSVFTSVQSRELGLGFYRYAHNDWVQLAAEAGLVGVTIALAFAFMVARLAYARLKEDGTGCAWWLTLGATGSLAALAAHSLFDFNLHIPSNAFLASATVGLLCVSATSVRPGSRQPSMVNAQPKLALASVLCVTVAMVAAIHLAVSHYASTALMQRAKTSSMDDAEVLLRAHRLCPRNPRPLHMLSVLYTTLAKQAEGRAIERYYREAVRYGRLAIELNPTYPLYHERQGLLRYWAGGSPKREDYESAERHLQQAVEFDPAYPNWTLSLAQFYLNTGRFSEADEYFARAVALNPRNVQEVIAALWTAGTPVERIRKILPDTIDAHTALGDYLKQKGNTVEAGESYAYACQSTSQASVSEKTAAALRLARYGKTSEAKSYLLNWMKKDGQHLEYLRALAEIAALEKDEEAELLYLQKIVQDSNATPKDQAELASALRSAGNWEGALALYQKAYRLDPRSERLCDRVSECLSKLGREDEATEIARDFILRNPDSARGHFRLGRLLYKQGLVMEAIGHYEKASALEPKNEHYKKELSKAVQALETLR